ncbi:xylose isomerase-like protein [Phyllosticta citriasiana]|uniref:Xylose isomerase-like protein n=1 Tax=Phyllosticta citriasiana TaxID=595635 RepID=A0ABR1KJA6_9PEZI
MADRSRQARSTASTTRKRGAEHHDDDDNAAAAREPVKRTKRATRGAAKANYAEESADDERPDAKVDTKESTAPKKSARGRKSKTAVKDEDEAGVEEEAETKAALKKPGRKARAQVKKEDEAMVDGENGAAAKKTKRRTKAKGEEEPAAPFAERTVGHSFKIGAHVSASGGVQNAITNSNQIGGNAFALFLKNQRRWTNAPLKEETAIMFKAACKEHKYESEKDVVPHGSYLVNLAHVDPERTQQAYDSFLDDVSRCHQLGIKLYNFHPGNAASSTRDEALKQLASNLNRVHADPSTGSVITLLETMAVFTGNTIGGTFEELRAIIDQVSDKTRVGVCLDTCHVFAAGYDLRTPDAFSAVLDKFDQVIGLDYLKALHLNDSKAPLSSGRDLHANIGTGFLGLRAFHALMNEPRLRGLPMVLETPIDVPDPKNPGKTTEDRAVWAREIKLLESLVGMDAESDAFVQLEAELQNRGRSERERVQAQVDKREEKKGGKQTKLSFGRAKEKKKKKGDEEDGGEGSEEE